MLRGAIGSEPKIFVALCIETRAIRPYFAAAEDDRQAIPTALWRQRYSRLLAVAGSEPAKGAILFYYVHQML